MDFYLMLFIGISVVSLILYGLAFFNTKRKKTLSIIISIVAVTVLYVAILIDQEILTGLAGVMVFEFVPALMWLSLFGLVYDKTFLNNKLRITLLITLFSIFLVLIILFFSIDEASEAFRQVYIVPIVSLAFLYAVLRIVQKGQKKTWFFLVLISLQLLVLVVFIGAPALAYFIVSTGGFLFIYFIYGFFLGQNSTLEESYFGKEKKIIPKISQRTFILMTGTFIVIFLLTLFFFYVVMRELFATRLQVNLNYQNYVISETLKSEVVSGRELLSGLSMSENITAREVYRELSSYDKKVLAVKVTGGGQESIAPQAFNIDEYSHHMSGSVSGITSSFAASKNYTNPILILSRQDGASKIDVYIDVGYIFETQERADEYFFASRIGLFDKNGSIIAFPLEQPYLEDLNNPSASFMRLCSEAFNLCEGENCPPLNKRFLVDETSFESSLISNSTQAVPELNLCLFNQVRLNETVVPPDSEQSVNFAVVGIVFFMTFVLASRSFESSITTPLRKLYENVQKMKEDEEAKSLELKYDDEIGKLARSFNELVVQLNEARKNIERKVVKRTKELNSEKEKIEVIIQSMKDGMLFVSNDDVVQLFNASACTITGLDFSEAIGKKYQEVFNVFEEKDMKKAIDTQAVLKNGETDLIKALLKQKDGEYVSVQFSIAPVEYGKKQIGFVIIFQDIAQEREVQLMKQNFASIASHQLKTPMAAVKWLIEMVLDEKGKLTDEHQKYLQQAFEANNQMIELVNELLKVSRIESGKIKVQVEEMGVEPIIKNILKAHEANAASHNARLSYEEPQQELPRVMGDASLTESVLDNFVSNAIEYSDPKRKNNVVIRVKVDGDMLRVEVEDKGIGVKDEDKTRVFTSFFRSEGAEEVRTEGTGLGLFIAKMIIENSGGKIGFTSKHGVGSTFYFKLPIQK